MPISVDDDGAGFVIRMKDDAGLTVSEVKASGADILSLAQSAQLLRARVLERFQPATGLGGHGAVYSTPVEGMILAETSLADALLLTLRAPNGAETTYTLEPELAQHLADRLVAKLADLGNAELPKQ